jgi:hypothetical protein
LQLKFLQGFGLTIGTGERVIVTNKNHGTGQRLPEDEEDRQVQREVKQQVNKWGRATCYLGLALVVTSGAWFLFFSGQPLHRLWETWGRILAVTSLCIFLPFLYAAGTTLNLWLYGARLRKIDRDFATGRWNR